LKENEVKGEGVWAGKASEESTSAKAAEATVTTTEPATLQPLFQLHFQDRTGN
jgi:hypothetical protein